MRPKTKREKVPAAACMLELEGAAVVLEAAAGDAPARFRIQALSGKPMPGHYYWGNLAINLQGLSMKKRVPILLDHDPAQRIGFSEQRSIDGNGLQLEGEFLPNSKLSQQVRAESKDGFPFQASIRFKPHDVLRLSEGENANVNGHLVEGPASVIQKADVREVSFCALGFDANTAAAALKESPDAEADFTQSQATEDTSMTPEEEKKLREEAAAAEKKRRENELAEQEKAKQLQAEAAAAERKRAKAIRDLAVPEQTELAEELVEVGATLEVATGRLAADLKTRHQKLRQEVDAGSDRALSGGNRRNAEVASGTALEEVRKLPPGLAKWRKEFELDAGVRAEFFDATSYIAFQLAQGQMRRMKDDGKNILVLSKVRDLLGRVGQADELRSRMQPTHEQLEAQVETMLSVSSQASPLTMRNVMGGYVLALAKQLGESWYRSISSVYDTNQPSEIYPWLGAAPVLRKWLGERTIQELRSDSITIVNDDYETGIEFRSQDLRRDKTAQMMERVGDLAVRVARHPEYLLTQLLLANGNAYDGTAYFSTSRTVGNSGTINNALTTGDGLAGGSTPTTAQVVSNLIIVLSKMMAYKDDQGQPLNEGMKQIGIMVPATLWGPTVAGITAAFTSASASNAILELAKLGVSFVPILNARLTTGNVFYAFRLDAGIKALIVQEEGVEPVDLGPGSERFKMTNRAYFGHGWQGGVGYGRPELAVQATC